MDNNEKKLIEKLFLQLREIEYQDCNRDIAAEKLINKLISEQPSTLYYMVRAALIQEEMIRSLNSRISKLENSVSHGQRSSFLSGLFKKSSSRRESSQYPEYATSLKATTNNSSGSFFGGALQTAIGVGSGVLMADAIRNLVNSSQVEGGMRDISDISAVDSGERSSSFEDNGKMHQENEDDSYISDAEQDDFDGFGDDDFV